MRVVNVKGGGGDVNDGGNDRRVHDYDDMLQEVEEKNSQLNIVSRC